MVQKKCDHCGRIFWCNEDWAYRAYDKSGRRMFFCRYNHLAAWDKQRAQKRRSQGKAVRSETTGQVYPSAAAAAEELQLDAHNVQNACRRGGGHCGGHVWNYVEAKA